MPAIIVVLRKDKDTEDESWEICTDDHEWLHDVPQRSQGTLLLIRGSVSHIVEQV